MMAIGPWTRYNLNPLQKDSLTTKHPFTATSYLPQCVKFKMTNPEVFILS